MGCRLYHMDRNSIWWVLFLSFSLSLSFFFSFFFEACHFLRKYQQPTCCNPSESGPPAKSWAGALYIYLAFGPL